MSNIWDKLEDKPYQINIGNSIKSKNVSYHSIKYNIKPPSIDHSKQGALHCNQEEDVFIVEYASQQSEEILQFSGEQMEANKELILFYDEETKTITLEKLDSTFNVRRDAFNKSKSILSELNNGEVKLQKPTTKTKRITKATTKGKTKNNSTKSTAIPKQKPTQNTFEEESFEEFEMSDNQNEENLDNMNPLAAYERMRAESKRAKKASETHTSSSKSQENEEDKMIKEFEANLEELDLEEEAEKEIEEFALENELEQELEKELEVSGDEGETKLTDNELEEEVLEEINDTLELDSSEDDSEDNMTPNNKRKMDQDLGSSKKSKPDVYDGPISLSKLTGNEEEEEESIESSSSDEEN